MFETYSNTDANFLNLHIDKATKTLGDKQLYLITHFTKQILNLNYLLLTLNVTVQLLKNRKGHSFSKFKFSLNGGDLVFWFTFNLAVHFRPKMALTLENFQTKCTRYLGIALATHFSSSSLVLRGLNLHSAAICFATQRVRAELTNS